jgi:hypothetical protein
MVSGWFARWMGLGGWNMISWASRLEERNLTELERNRSLELLYWYSSSGEFGEWKNKTVASSSPRVPLRGKYRPWAFRIFPRNDNLEMLGGCYNSWPSFLNLATFFWFKSALCRCQDISLFSWLVFYFIGASQSGSCVLTILLLYGGI